MKMTLVTTEQASTHGSHRECSTHEPPEFTQNTVVQGSVEGNREKDTGPCGASVKFTDPIRNVGVRTSSSHEPPEFTENTVDHQGAPLRLQQRAKTPLLESKYQKGRPPYLLQEY